MLKCILLSIGSYSIIKIILLFIRANVTTVENNIDLSMSMWKIDMSFSPFLSRKQVIKQMNVAKNECISKTNEK